MKGMILRASGLVSTVAELAARRVAITQGSRKHAGQDT